ncbi:nuclear transport factor 2 family protein [Kitasatospora sp. NPDC048239]|uniref:nuclear transport factor 2 family protein n=1 Tax=Kitasatospora sp. NPDC048239 TaxID=3364046 RepID=UPI00371CDB37
MTRSDYQSLVKGYMEVWNLPDEVRRARIDEVFTEDVVYTDPAVVARGRADLDAYIGMTRERFGGLPFDAEGPVDGHHRQVRFRWRCGGPQAAPVARGQDFALIERGRIKAVYGFFE